MATSETNSAAKGLLGSLRHYVLEFDLANKVNQKNLGKAWQDWLGNLEACLQLEMVPRDHWKRIMMVLGGQELRDKITALNQNDADYEDCKGALTDYFKDKRSLNSLRHQFFSMRPKEEESTREWMERCQTVGKECEFDTFTLKDAMTLNLCQYTTIGKLRNEILVKELKYDDAVSYAQTLELAAKESKILESKCEERDHPPEEVLVMKRPGPYSARAKRAERLRDGGECGRCGLPEPHECRALRAECHHCHRRGHFARKCRTKNVQRVEEEHSETSE